MRRASALRSVVRYSAGAMVAALVGMPLSTAYAETSTPSPTTSSPASQRVTTGSAATASSSGQTAVASAPTRTPSPSPTESSPASLTGTPAVRDDATATTSSPPASTGKPAHSPTPDATPPGSADQPPTTGPRPGAAERRSNAKAVAPAALDPSVVAITKTASAPEVNAGDSFSYQLTPSCSGLTTGCVGMTVTDTIPTDLVVDEAALLAQSNPPAYTITYVEATRTVTIVYAQTLSSPPGTTGGRPARPRRRSPSR